MYEDEKAYSDTSPVYELVSCRHSQQCELVEMFSDTEVCISKHSL